MSPLTTPPLVDALDTALLTALVRQAYQRPTLILESWQVQPMAGLLNLSTGGVFRVAGAAHDQGLPLDWSLVLKVVCAPAGVAGDDWRREALAYQSGLLNQLGGDLRAPRCLGVVELAGGRGYWIWLEDLTDAYAGRWPLPRYALAARHLGTFNGAYLAGQPLPTYPWLRPGGMGVARLDPAASLVLVEDAATRDHPLVRQAIPAPLMDRLRTLVLESADYQAALRRLPQTLCHGDAAFFNLVAQRDAQGTDHTMALDWAQISYGALGEEISVLIWPSMTEFQLDLADAARLEAEVLAGYTDGVREAGWDGDARLVEVGATLHAAVRWCCYPMVVALAVNTEQHAALEAFFGRSIGDIVTTWSHVTERIMDRLDDVQERLP